MKVDLFFKSMKNWMRRTYIVYRIAFPSISVINSGRVKQPLLRYQHCLGTIVNFCFTRYPSPSPRTDPT